MPHTPPFRGSASSACTPDCNGRCSQQRCRRWLRTLRRSPCRQGPVFGRLGFRTYTAEQKSRIRQLSLTVPFLLSLVGRGRNVGVVIKEVIVVRTANTPDFSHFDSPHNSLAKPHVNGLDAYTQLFGNFLGCDISHTSLVRFRQPDPDGDRYCRFVCFRFLT